VAPNLGKRRLKEREHFWQRMEEGQVLIWIISHEQMRKEHDGMGYNK
jgi:hypothetical protein